jgi:YggT family protein
MADHGLAAPVGQQAPACRPARYPALLSGPVIRPSPPLPEGYVHSLIILIDMVLNLYMWVLIASAILSWLVAFNVINTRNRVVYAIGDFLYRITEPLLRPIRRILPNLGGIDLSPVVLILLLIFIRNLLWEYLA